MRLEFECLAKEFIGLPRFLLSEALWPQAGPIGTGPLSD
jgi:hypothetical protein